MYRKTLKQIALVKRLLAEDHPSERTHVEVWKEESGLSRSRYYPVQQIVLQGKAVMSGRQQRSQGQSNVVPG